MKDLATTSLLHWFPFLEYLMIMEKLCNKRNDIGKLIDGERKISVYWKVVLTFQKYICPSIKFRKSYKSYHMLLPHHPPDHIPFHLPLIFRYFVWLSWKIRMLQKKMYSLL